MAMGSNTVNDYSETISRESFSVRASCFVDSRLKRQISTDYRGCYKIECWQKTDQTVQKNGYFLSITMAKASHIYVFTDSLTLQMLTDKLLINYYFHMLLLQMKTCKLLKSGWLLILQTIICFFCCLIQNYMQTTDR